jgi:hypothetical protein
MGGEMMLYVVLDAVVEEVVRHKLTAAVSVTSCILETLIKVINKKLGANTSLNQKAEFKNKV